MERELHRPNRSSTIKRSAEQSDRYLGSADSGFRERLSFATVQLARAIMLASLVYGCWRLGVDGLGLQYKLCIALLITLLLCLVHLVLRRKSSRRPLKSGLIAVGVCWIAYAHFQTVPLPSALISLLAPGTQSVRADFIDNHLAQLESTPVNKNIDDHVSPLTTLSTVPGETRRRIARDTVGLGFLFCALLLFNTRRSRHVFAWTLLLNAAGLASWGIIQKASDSNHLFPGIPNPIDSSYFSTFIYKNAAAAALLSGIAIAAGFMYWIHLGCAPKIFAMGNESRPRRSRGSFSDLQQSRGSLNSRRSQGSRKSYGKPNHWIEPVHIGVCCLLGVLAVGLIVSQSRGACAAACLATIMTLIIALRSIRLLDTFIGITVLVITATVFIWLTDLHDDASRSTQRVTVQRLAADSRWNHWQDGITTSYLHAPFGAGVGTYGYASLAQQSYDSPVWFREAHNQYLETITEAGIIGLLLLAAFCGIIGKMCWQLVKSSVSREARGWGLIGLLLFVALAFQSLFDFVVIIPANMFLFAAIFGVVLSVHQEHAATKNRPVNSAAGDNRAGWSIASIAAAARHCYGRVGHLSYSTAMLLMLGIAVMSYQQQISSKYCLEATALPTDAYRPTAEETTTNLAKLDSAIAAEPSCANLYKRRALWQSLRLRNALLEAAENESVVLRWEQTSYESLFALFASLDAESQASLQTEIISNQAIKQALASAVADTSKSLTLNPFIPQSHMTATFLSPLQLADPQPWAQNCRRLSRSSPELFFANGMIGLWLKDTEVMLDQWRRNLRFSRDRQELILASARKVLQPRQVVFELIPEERTDLLLRYVQAIHQSEQTEFAAALLEHSLQSARQNKMIDEGERHALLGRMYSLAADEKASREHWSAALEHDPRNLNYRYEYAKSLIRCKDYDTAIRQAVLGQTLEPGSNRFKVLADRIEREQVRHQARAYEHLPR